MAETKRESVLFDNLATDKDVLFNYLKQDRYNVYLLCFKNGMPHTDLRKEELFYKINYILKQDSSVLKEMLNAKKIFLKNAPFKKLYLSVIISIIKNILKTPIKILMDNFLDSLFLNDIDLYIDSPSAKLQDEESAPLKVHKKRKILTLINDWCEKLFISNIRQEAKELLKQKSTCIASNYSPKGKIAIYSTLPPDKSGIANFSAKAFVNQDGFDLIGAFKSKEDYESSLNYLENKADNIFEYSYCYKKDKFKNYKAHIYVIGNHFYNETPLLEAIRTKGKKNRFLYIHEATLIGGYPSNIQNEMRKFGAFNLKWNMEQGIYQLITLTGITNIIVNNEACKKLILHDMPPELASKIKIHMAYHPIEDLINTKKESFENYTIGTFGAPNNLKQTDEIVKAIEILNNKGLNIKLVIAGYDVQSYLDKFEKVPPFIIPYDSKSKDELFKVMNSVNLAIQLRKKTHGESSGCIAQLLGMRQKILTTEGFINPKLEKYLFTIKTNCSDEELAEKIERIMNLEGKFQKDDNLCEEFSYNKLAHLIEDMVNEVIGEKNE